MTRDDARKIQAVLKILGEQPPATTPEQRAAREAAASLAHQSFMIVPAGPGNISRDDLMATWPLGHAEPAADASAEPLTQEA